MPASPSTIIVPNALTWDENGHIYAIQGNTAKKLYRFSIADNAWVTMADAPVNLSYLSWGCEYANGYIYAPRGNSDFPYVVYYDFYRYSISGDSWEEVAPVNAVEWYTVGYGDLCWIGGYHLLGLGLMDNEYGEPSNYITRYSTMADEWASSTSFPDVFANPFQIESEGTPATSQAYINLAENDGTYWQATGVSVYAQYFKFNIQEDIETIDNITVTWDGWAYAIFGPKDTYLELWNEGSVDWELMVAEPTHNYDNFSFGFTLAENFDNYIDENGNLWILYWINYAGASLNTDYIEVQVI